MLQPFPCLHFFFFFGVGGGGDRWTSAECTTSCVIQGFYVSLISYVCL